MTRARRIALIICAAPLISMALAPAVFGADGEGLYGRTNDKVVTFFSFGVIAFFAIFVIVMSLIQMRLENRKDRARDELERLRRP